MSNRLGWRRLGAAEVVGAPSAEKIDQNVQTRFKEN
jgi:hypothetical protein